MIANGSWPVASSRRGAPGVVGVSLAATLGDEAAVAFAQAFECFSRWDHRPSGLHQKSQDLLRTEQGVSRPALASTEARKSIATPRNPAAAARMETGA